MNKFLKTYIKYVDTTKFSITKIHPEIYSGYINLSVLNLKPQNKLSKYTKTGLNGTFVLKYFNNTSTINYKNNKRHGKSVTIQTLNNEKIKVVELYHKGVKKPNSFKSVFRKFKDGNEKIFRNFRN